MTPDEIRESVIVPVVDALGGGEAAVNLIYRTGLAESGYRTVVQAGGGPALGYLAVRAGHLQRLLRELHPVPKGLCDDLTEGLRASRRGRPFPPWLKTNHGLAAALCRIHYRRVSAPLPQAEDIEGQAEYWLRYYNAGGPGSVQHFLDAVEFNG